MTCAAALSLFMFDPLLDDDPPHDAKSMAETRRSDRTLKVLFFIFLPPSKLCIIFLQTQKKILNLHYVLLNIFVKL
jgi:phage terminase large subunit-like protein